MDLNITNISRATGNNLASQFTMRWRLAADPDVAGSYTAVTTTQTKMGLTYPFFDVNAFAAGVYVVHTYVTADGDTTGTKITVEITGTGS
jgi:hypothetical protein